MNKGQLSQRKTLKLLHLKGDLGQRETQVTYMRGLLKNFVAIDELRKDIKQSTDGVIHEQMNIMVRMGDAKQEIQ